MGVRISTVAYSTYAYGGHPGGRWTGGHPGGRWAGGHPGGRSLQGDIRACAMGEGGHGGSSIGEAGGMYQQLNI
jgi:hypothetical protein